MWLFRPRGSKEVDETAKKTEDEILRALSMRKPAKSSKFFIKRQRASDLAKTPLELQRKQQQKRDKLEMKPVLSRTNKTNIERHPELVGVFRSDENHWYAILHQAGQRNIHLGKCHHDSASC